MRKFLLIAAVVAVLAVPVGVSAAAPSAKPTTTTAPTTTTTPPPSGITGWEIVSQGTPDQIQPGENATLEPKCPAGKVVLSGGWELSNENLEVIFNMPRYNGATYSWLLVVKNNNPVPYGAQAYAVCADGA